MSTSGKSPSRKRRFPGCFTKLATIFSVVDSGRAISPEVLRAIAKLARREFKTSLFGSFRNEVGRDLCNLIVDAANDLDQVEALLDRAEQALHDAGWSRQSRTGDWLPPPRPPGLVIGDSVSKVGGDYTFDGEVRAVLLKQSGAVRYVVEDNRGVLHIFSAKQLGPRERARSA